MRAWRMLAAVAVAIAVTTAATGCTSSPGEGGPDPSLRGQWELTAASDTSGTLDLYDQHVTLTIAGDRTTSGRSSCSDYVAQLFGKLDSLYVRVTRPEAADCRSIQQKGIQSWYLRILGEVRTASTTGGVLSLNAPEGTLVFQRALARPTQGFVNRSWKLTSAASTSQFVGGSTRLDVPANAPAATLRFSSNGIVFAHDDCQELLGRWSQNAGEIVIANLQLSSTSPCTTFDAAEHENLFRVLTAPFTFRTFADQLTLVSSRAGIQLDFGDPIA